MLEPHDLKPRLRAGVQQIPEGGGDPKGCIPRKYRLPLGDQAAWGSCALTEAYVIYPEY